MLRTAAVAAMLIVMSAAAPAVAVNSKDKMATCKFGADDQKLKGPARAKFMKNCMANKNDPRGMAVPDTAAPPKN